MSISEANFPVRRIWVAILALMSLLVLIVTTIDGGQPAAIATGPVDLSSYRPTVVMLGLGVVFAVITVVLNRSLAPVWLRWLSVGMACCGGALAAFLLIGLIGICGLVVLGGTCNP